MIVAWIGLTVGSTNGPRGPDWRAWVLLFLGGAAFYGYLLWEINGPIHKAVDRYVAEARGD
jgi:hypothetical protein